MKVFALFLMASFYVFAGIMHLIKPGFFLKIMPPFIPYHKELVFLSGIAEILLGVGLLFPDTRSMAAIGLVILLIMVFPANIYMAFGEKFQSISPLIRFGRLPLQYLLIWWAWIYK